MGGRRFDAWTQRLVMVCPRRAVLRAVGAGLVAVLGQNLADKDAAAAARTSRFQEISPHCDAAPRLAPSDYLANVTQFDAVCLPEAWHFMKDKWQGLRPNVPGWPTLVVIDDGFFPTDDSGIRPELRSGYPDGSGVHPRGSAWGDMPPREQVAAYGYHGTSVLSLLASRANNALLIAGVCGPWSNISGGQDWGATLLPVRIGRGVAAIPTPTLLAQIFDEVVFSLDEIRVVNISKDLVELDLPDGSELEARIRKAAGRQVLIVTGAGNTRETVKPDRWIRQFDNVVVVGALNPKGTDFWIDGASTGTASGPGVDLYAPGEDLTVIEARRSTNTASGTTYAAPMVSGVAVMMLNVEPTLAPWEVRDILVKTADFITPESGGSDVPRVNAYRAVSCASTFRQEGTC